jgi:hypothetical protein
MPAESPESEPTMVSIAGVLPPLCTGKENIIIVSMTKVIPRILWRESGAVDPRYDVR